MSIVNCAQVIEPTPNRCEASPAIASPSRRRRLQRIIAATLIASMGLAVLSAPAAAKFDPSDPALPGLRAPGVQLCDRFPEVCLPDYTVEFHGVPWPVWNEGVPSYEFYVTISNDGSTNPGELISHINYPYVTSIDAIRGNRDIVTQYHDDPTAGSSIWTIRHPDGLKAGQSTTLRIVIPGRRPASFAVEANSPGAFSDLSWYVPVPTGTVHDEFDTTNNLERSS